MAAIAHRAVISEAIVSDGGIQRAAIILTHVNSCDTECDQIAGENNCQPGVLIVFVDTAARKETVVECSSMASQMNADRK